MNLREHLLMKISEECLEVAQRVSKALLFGAHEVQDGQKEDNLYRINREWNDLQGAIELYEQNYGKLCFRNEDMIVAKKQKIVKYLKHAIAQGTLQGCCPQCISEDLEVKLGPADLSLLYCNNCQNVLGPLE